MIPRPAVASEERVEQPTAASSDNAVEEPALPLREAGPAEARMTQAQNVRALTAAAGARHAVQDAAAPPGNDDTALELRLAQNTADIDVPPMLPAEGTMPNAREETTGLTEQQMSRYDLNKDGRLDEIEKTIARYDTNKDGNFSLEEVREIVADLEAANAEKKHLKKIIGGAFVALIIVCVSMLVITIIANEISKDTDQTESGRLTIKGTDTTIQTASSDMVVADGVLMPRSLTGLGATPLKTAVKTTAHALSSEVPDKYLQELESFSYTDPTDGILKMVKVNSLSRVPQFGAMCGSVVVMQTPLGEFTLDHEHLYHDGLAQWIDVAGQFSLDERRRLFASAHGRRRLGAHAGASGMFNFLDAEKDAFECKRAWVNQTYEVTPTAPKYPYSYTAYSILCESPTVSLVNHTPSMTNGVCVQHVGKKTPMPTS
jgi:hypothetical protein